MIWEIKNKKVTLRDPVKGLRVVDLEYLRNILGESENLLYLEEQKSTNNKIRMSWFTPLVKKYKNH